MRRRWLIIAAAGLLAAILCLDLYTARMAHPAQDSAAQWQGGIFAGDFAENQGGVAWKTAIIDEKGESEHWLERVKAVGGRKAYAEFATHVAELDYPSQHTVAHFFGRALYEIEGLKGVSVCDDRFAYGCFHEFLSYAVAGHGVSVIKDLDAVCQTQPTLLKAAACQHGIGHGLVSYFGYTQKDLSGALDACKTLKNPDSMGGCYAGAFMEYNRHSMIALDAGARIPTKENFMTPCDTVSDEYKAVCALWQPLWWQGEMFKGAHDEKTMAQMGEMCRAFGEKVGYKETCFYGIGFVSAPETLTERPDALAMCPAASKTKEERQWCLDYGAYISSALVDLSHGLAICNAMSGEDKALCERYAKTTGSVLTKEDLE